MIFSRLKSIASVLLYKCLLQVFLSWPVPYTFMRYTSVIVSILIAVTSLAFSQSNTFVQTSEFTRQDTLLGAITPERVWWDLTYYHLSVKANPGDSTLSGENTIRYKVLQPHQVMQIDLQEPMQMKEVYQDGQSLTFKKEGDAYFVELKEKQDAGDIHEIIVHFGGKPEVSKNPPWSGGLVWQRDAQGHPFVATVCQGDGASLWWPCKDHPYDEPDSMHISITAPAQLTGVSNGKLINVQENADDTKTFHWFVSNPINNYGVNMNIGNYVHFSEKYEGEKGMLDCNYYVLPENLAKAKKQFTEVTRMLEAFEHWFGPYPFYEDGYKLVEVPYLGMEHQSSVTYGNGYTNGYKQKDLSHTGWGMTFDFIIVHESGHEWFANNITYKDIADMWIHESFTAYSENLFLDYHKGKEASSAYVIGTRINIKNDRPVIGIYGVNHAGSGDMYYKGANMLHMLRQLVGDDEKWRSILRGINQEFYHQTVTTRQVEQYLSKCIGSNLSLFFDQYLRDTSIPVLEYYITGQEVNYRWSNCVAGFDMPVQVQVNGTTHWIEPTTTQWKKVALPAAITTFSIDPDFYVASFNLTGKKFK